MHILLYFWLWLWYNSKQKSLKWRMIQDEVFERKVWDEYGVIMCCLCWHRQVRCSFVYEGEYAVIKVNKTIPHKREKRRQNEM